MSRRSLAVLAICLVATLGPQGVAGASESAEETDAARGTYRAAVVGGAEAAPGTWPFIAAVVRPDSQGMRHLCGGVLVAEGWVLTAAHCTEHDVAQPHSLTVLIGRQDLREGDGEEIGASRIVSHPSYDPSAVVGSFDMALIELSRPSRQPPVPMMGAAEEPVWSDADHQGVVAGWGNTRPQGGEHPSRLRQASLPIWSDPSCEDTIGPTYRGDRHLCAGSPEGSACDGDSGGPFLAPNHRDELRLAAVVSYGSSDCTGAPAVFNQVSHYRSWIDATVNGSSSTRTRPSASEEGETSVGAAGAADASQGYSLLTADGDVHDFGDATARGSTAGVCAPTSCFDMAAAPGDGYWISTTGCAVHSFGAAPAYPSPATDTPCYLAADRQGRGLWALTTTGTVHGLGGVSHFGQHPGPANGSWLEIEPTPRGDGYWLVGDDGGIFTFGAARFFGSTGSLDLNEPIVSMAATRSGNGYWLVASDGGIFTFGDASFHGSAGGMHLAGAIVDMAVTPSGRGYWLFSRDGGVFPFGDAQFLGAGGQGTTPVVAAAAR